MQSGGNKVNIVSLCGELGETPRLSHESFGKKIYTFPLVISRLSGIEDTINILAPEEALNSFDLSAGPQLLIEGELRSFNNKKNEGSKLIISVYAFEIDAVYSAHKNEVSLEGVICREPVFRQTPLGRDICDVMIAVNRRYRRTDYLPCILWGKSAKETSELMVGTKIHVDGRIQSRQYIKQLEGVGHQRVAFEVSVTKASVIEENEREIKKV